MRRGNQGTTQVSRLTLPPDIAAGLEDVSQRSGWNRNLPVELEEFALPTETWREFIVRRGRYDELRARIESGGVHEVNDLVTLNLDIRKLALDIVRYAGSEDLVESFYKAIESVTILDPTCGSGAFLFAALEILEPLYEACLQRMEQFITEAEAEAKNTGVKLHFNRFAHFRKTLTAAAKHVNQEYFILKTIIVNNLYGVDIMEEATEICKLRLFLKLVAQIDPKHKERIEPLPDIDFNIRAGNTLVGYARFVDVKSAVEAKLAFDDPMSRINDKLATLDLAVEQFRLQQTELGGSVTSADKAEVNRKFAELEVELDDFLAGESGVKKNAQSKWKADTKPFHWFCAFHSILQRGGFDIIIGNPPYVELKEIKDYQLRGYTCLDCGNLYAVTMERCMAIGSSAGRSGFIVPVSSISTDRYQGLQMLLNRKAHWAFGSFDDRPSRLFDGLEHIRLTIHVFENAESAKGSHFSTRYNKWASVERPTLLDALVFEDSNAAIVAGTMPKFSAHIEQSICSKLIGDGTQLALASSGRGSHKVFYSRKVGYFLQVLDFEPTVLDGKGNRRPPSEFKTLSFHNRDEADAALCALNSSLFYWFITVFSDCRHVNKREVDTLPFNARKAAGTFGKDFETLGTSLMKSLIDTSEMRKMKFSHDTLTVQCIFPKRSKVIIDQIDRVLAKHYGFTDEEVDFIINYDIKYRMGVDSGDDEVDD
jgi:hypothetical protein